MKHGLLSCFMFMFGVMKDDRCFASVSY